MKEFMFLFLISYFSVVSLYGMEIPLSRTESTVMNESAHLGDTFSLQGADDQSNGGVAVGLDELPGYEAIEEDVLLKELNPLLPDPSSHISTETRNGHILQALNRLEKKEPNRHRCIIDTVQTRRKCTRGMEFGVSPGDIREVTDFLAKEVLNKENGLLSEKLTSEKAQKVCSVVMTVVVIAALLTAEVLFVTLG